MNLEDVSPGEDVSNYINLLIVIAAHGSAMKYEVDQDRGIFVD